jgi:hypothetical protein
VLESTEKKAVGKKRAGNKRKQKRSRVEGNKEEHN